MTDPLRLPLHNGHLMTAALRRHRDRPVMHLGETTLTGAQTAARISQYVQAFESVSTAPSALLALNRPEVLYIPTKDMIVTGGFNVYPREVEDVVSTHPAVGQVAVIGTPDEKWGEVVTAIIVPRDRAAIDDRVVAEIQALVKEHNGSVQVPKQVYAVDAIPLTGLGKPDKKALRARFWTGGRTVG